MTSPHHSDKPGNQRVLAHLGASVAFCGGVSLIFFWAIKSGVFFAPMTSGWGSDTREFVALLCLLFVLLWISSAVYLGASLGKAVVRLLHSVETLYRRSLSRHSDWVGTFLVTTGPIGLILAGVGLAVGITGTCVVGVYEREADYLPAVSVVLVGAGVCILVAWVSHWVLGRRMIISIPYAVDSAALAPAEGHRDPSSLQFSEGLAPVRMENDRWGYVARSGTKLRTVIDGQFQAAWEFSEGLAAVKTDQGVGYIDVRGSYMIPPRSDWHSPTAFREGRATVEYSVHIRSDWDQQPSMTLFYRLEIDRQGNVLSEVLYRQS